MLDTAISALGCQEPNEAAATLFIQAHDHAINAGVQLCGPSLWFLLALFTGTLMERYMSLCCHIPPPTRPGCIDGAQLQDNYTAAKLTNLSFYKSLGICPAYKSVGLGC